jgi:hypothetical protein
MSNAATSNHVIIAKLGCYCGKFVAKNFWMFLPIISALFLCSYGGMHIAIACRLQFYIKGCVSLMTSKTPVDFVECRVVESEPAAITAHSETADTSFSCVSSPNMCCRKDALPPMIRRLWTRVDTFQRPLIISGRVSQITPYTNCNTVEPCRPMVGCTS